MRRSALLLLILALLLLMAAPAFAAAQQERRVALVIGNGAYKDAPLKNPVNDARDMTIALRSLGFEVITRENASLRQMEDALDEFWKSIKRGGTGLFFFAGHGLQVKGVNYLVPVDARISVEQDAKSLCLDAGRVLGRMENAGNRLNIVLLDACRNNPFARSWRSADAGLAKMDAPTGTLIGYATAPDSVAADGAGKNGVYTQHLLREMRVPGQTIENAMKRVRIGVLKDTDRKQTPWESSSLTGDFYFAGGGQAGGQTLASLAPLAPVPPLPQPADQGLPDRLAGTYRWVVNDGSQEYGQFTFSSAGGVLSGSAAGFMLTSASKSIPLENVRLDGSRLTFQVRHAGTFQFTPSIYSFRCDLAAGLDEIPVVELSTPQLKRPIVSSRLVRVGNAAGIASQQAPAQAPAPPAQQEGRPQAGSTTPEQIQASLQELMGGRNRLGTQPPTVAAEKQFAELKVRIVYTADMLATAERVQALLKDQGLSVELFRFSQNGKQKGFMGNVYYTRGQEAHARRIAELVQPVEVLKPWSGPSALGSGLDISLWIVR